MMNRKGIEMAASTLVVMVLGILIVIGGMVFVWRIVEKGSELNTQVTSQQQAQVRSMLSGGQLVAVFPAIQEVRPGKSVAFALGIENRLDAKSNFTIDLDVFDKDGNPLLEGEHESANSWQLIYFDTISLERGEQQDVQLLIRPPLATAVGTYAVIARVTSESGQEYDSKSFSVRVE